jgi:adsorption protein B
MLVLSIAYLALLAWVTSWLLHLAWPGPQPVIGPAMRVLLEINAVLLAWRLVLRIGFTVDAYGWREACWVPLRMLVANMISLRAARLAMIRYWTMLRGGEVHWDKTRHDFPDDIVAALDR